MCCHYTIGQCGSRQTSLGRRRRRDNGPPVAVHRPRPEQGGMEAAARFAALGPLGPVRPALSWTPLGRAGLPRTMILVGGPARGGTHGRA